MDKQTAVYSCGRILYRSHELEIHAKICINFCMKIIMENEDTYTKGAFCVSN